MKYVKLDIEFNNTINVLKQVFLVFYIMVLFYKSRKSEYYFKDRHLFRVTNNKESDWGSSVYSTEDSLLELLKKYRLEPNKKIHIDFKIAEEFLDELQDKALSLDNVGGRFVALNENSDYYSLYYSGKIIKIENKEDV